MRLSIQGSPSRMVNRNIYFDYSEFVEDLREGRLLENFVLEETVFMDLASRVALEPEIAKEIADKAVILMLSAHDGDEIDGLVALAQQFVGENEDG
jgi:hypothetical protein